MKRDVLRIIDAELNRAGEGLRVVEDFVRFVLDDRFLTAQMKSLRHDFGEATAAIPTADRHAARETSADVGTRISTEAEGRREDAGDVCAASFKRSEQALRSLEEYGKLADTFNNAEFAARCEAIRYRLYTFEKVVGIGALSRERLDGVRLCVLVGACNSTEEFERLVRELVAAGVGMIQLRGKGLDDRTLIERGRLLVSLTRGQPPALPGVHSVWANVDGEPPAEPGADGRARCSTLAIVNDRADVAAIVGADGVHLGQVDLSVKDARAIVGTRLLVGVSTHNIEQARAAVLDGANYLGAGPTFPSRTKTFETFAGIDFLREVSAEIRLPTFAIGGITTDNLADVLAAGVERMAVGAAITEAGRPGVAARELLVMLENSTSQAVAPFGD